MEAQVRFGTFSVDPLHPGDFYINLHCSLQYNLFKLSKSMILFSANLLTCVIRNPIQKQINQFIHSENDLFHGIIKRTFENPN